MALYLKSALFVDWRTLAPVMTHLRVTPGSAPDPIAVVPAALPAGDEMLDCRGRLVTRSFACGHHHVYSALALGMPPPQAQPTSFHEILERVWWRLDRRLDRDMIEASALSIAVDAVRCGTTFVLDHHSSPAAIEGSLETLVAAFERVGITCVPCYEMSDRDGVRAREQGLEETIRFLSSGRQGLVGLHASFTVGDDLLRRAVEAAERFGTGVHVHVAEDPVDQEITLRRHGCRVVERLGRAGVLASTRTVLAHCLHLDHGERELIARSPAWVAQNVESNLNNGVGAPAAAGPGGGARVVLGTDGLHSDMLRAAQFSHLATRAGALPTPLDSYKLLRAAHRYVDEAGFSGDGEDNLLVFDYPTRTDVIQANAVSHFIYGLRSSHLSSVISQGRLVMRERELVLVDEKEIQAMARSEAKRLWDALKRGN